MIACSGLTKTYRTPQGGVAGIREVSLEAGPGDWVVVRGPSGCGKSTLLLSLGGMLRPDSGEVRLGGVDLYRLGPGERAGVRARSVGFVFQLFHLVPYLTVWENVLSGMGTPVRGARERAERWMVELGLEGRRDAMPGTLSAGERQRTALARALAKAPAVLMADEPTGNLDPENARLVFEHMDRFRKEGGTVLLVTHGSDADRFATQVIEAQGGAAPHRFGLVNARMPRQSDESGG